MATFSLPRNERYASMEALESRCRELIDLCIYGALTYEDLEELTADLPPAVAVVVHSFGVALYEHLYRRVVPEGGGSGAA